MQRFIAMPLVTLCLLLHGSRQRNLCHTIIGSSLRTFHGLRKAVMSAWLGMALGTMTPRPVQLMCIVSKCLRSCDVS